MIDTLSRSGDVWTQVDESCFIRHLGTFSPEAKRSYRGVASSHPASAHGRERRQAHTDFVVAALKGYLVGLDKRRDWGKLDEFACRAEAEARIRELAAK